MLAHDFHSYNERIASKFRALGHELDLKTINGWPKRWTNLGWAKPLFRLPLIGKILNHFRFDEQDREMSASLNMLNEKYDAMFVIWGTFFGENCKFQTDRLLQPNSKRILYTWDSVKNTRGAPWLKERTLFSEIFSFDRTDCLNFGFTYRRLFTSFVKNKDVKQDHNSNSVRLKSFKIVFIGTGDLYRIIKLLQLRRFFISHGVTYKFITPIQSGIRRWIFKLLIGTDHYWQLAKARLEETYDIQSKADIVLDLPSPSQDGASIRCIECLDLGCRVEVLHPRPNYYGDEEIRAFLGISENVEALKNRLLVPNRCLNNKDQRFEADSIDEWVEFFVSVLSPAGEKN